VAIEELDEYPLAVSIHGPALHYKEGLVPLVALEPLLDEPRFTTRGGRRTARVIIVRSGSVVIGLTGSYNHIQQEAVLKPIGSMLRNTQLFTAALAQEDGSVALVINPAFITRASAGERMDPLEAASPPRANKSRPLAPADSKDSGPNGDGHTVLVAEDSPIVRDLVVEALRIHGLTVIEAADGQEAFEKLEEHPEVALLVTDVEMPRLDGLGLIKRIRARGGRRIPAIVVSTRGSDADKLAAVEVGADAYLVKSDFSQEGLWALVSRFLG
jgi:CheY-like chemotaxis protein